MTLQRMARLYRRRAAAAIAIAGLSVTGLAVTTSAPAQAALPPQCVTSGSQVTCTLDQNGSSNTMAVEIPGDVTSIQIHAVGQRGESTNGPGGSLVVGGKPAAIDASVPVTSGEVFTAHLLDDGGAAGTSSGDIEAGAGGSSVVVTRSSDVIIQAAGGGGAGAAVPVSSGGSFPYSAGGQADSMGFKAADTGSSGHVALGGFSGVDRYDAGLGGAGAWVYNCPGTLVFANGDNGTGSSGGQGGDGEYGGGGGGGGSPLGGGGGGAGGTGCEGFSYGGGGGGGGSVVPWYATYSHSTTESYLVRISFTVGPGEPDPPVTASYTPHAMSFGEVPVGSASAVQTMTVTNTGSVPLTLGHGVVSNTNSESFPKISDTCSNATVAPGATCQVGIRFKPFTSGDLSATFTLPDASTTSPHVVTLNGVGTRPVVFLSVSSLDFGGQEVGKTGAARTVTLTNTGNAPLVVSRTTVGVATVSDYKLVSDTCIGVAIAPNASCSVSVRFAPSAVGDRLDTMSFRHNAASASSFVSLKGIGTPPADLAIRGIGSVYTGRDHLVTRAVAGPGTVMIYSLVIVNEDTVPRSYEIELPRTGAAATAEVWTTGFGPRALHDPGSGRYSTAEIPAKRSVTYNLKVTPIEPGQTISGVEVALLSSQGGLIESVRTETNVAAPLKGTSSFELFSRQGGQPFVGGPVNGQTSTAPALNVGVATPFTLRLKNDGTSSQRIGLRLTDMDGCAGSFAVTVTAAGKVITTSAFGGTYLTPLLAPTKFQDVAVSIKRVTYGCPSKRIRAQSLNNGVAVRTSYLLANAAYNAATD